MIKKIKEKLLGISKTKKNILVLTSGSVIGQGLVIAASPILGRLYTQEAFGLLALYTSFATIFASLFTGKYEQAIFHPKDDSKALNLLFFTISLSGVFSFLLLIGLLLIHYCHIEIKSLVTFGKFVFLIPISTFSIGFYSCFQLWFQRKEEYKMTSLASILQSLIVIIGNFLFFFIGYKVNGLLMGYFFSLILPIIFLLYFFYKNNYIKNEHKKINIPNALAAAKEYINFPKYILASEFVLTLSQQFFPILIATLYSSSIVGLYSFSNRILRIPSILISNSVWGVYRNEAVKVLMNKQERVNLYLKTLKNLFLWGIGPFLFLGIFGKYLFIFVFGSSWEKSGLYAQIMALYLFSEFISYPLSSTFVIFNKQRINMWIQICTFSLCVFGIYLGKVIGGDVTSILLFSLFGLICNLMSIFFSYKIVLNE